MNNDLYKDIWMHRIVVAVLVLTVAASMAASEYSTLGVIVVALGSASIGVRSGLLALSPLTR